MAASTFDLHVLCTNKAATSKWDNIRDSYRDLQVNCAITACAIDTIRSISRAAARPFLVCQSDVWLGRGMANQVASLLEELNERFPNWALCGNRGVSWDGQHLYDYSHDIDAGGLQTSVCAYPVISVADDILLVNPAVLNSHREPAPSLPHGHSVLLSLECLRNGSVMAVSPHLLILRNDEPELESQPALDSAPEFRAYYRASFLNHHLATADGLIDLSRVVDYRYVSDPRERTPQRDVLDLYDQCLEPARAVRRPSLTICCRTQFGRPEMLERAVLSFAAFRQQTGPLAEVEVRLITDVFAAGVEAEVCRLQQAHPGAALQCWHHDIRPPRYSRTDLLLAAIERARTDYIWFVDDDDFANAASGPALARCLVPGAPLLIVASAAVIRENWGEGDEGRELLDFERSAAFQAAHLFRILRGRNFIPNCGMIFPVNLMQRRTAKVEALGNYNEDYFLLLLALTSSRVDVRILDYELSSISIRGEENTVAQTDRSEWRLSLATFLLEILNDTEGNSPFLWQLGNAQRW